MPAKRKMPKNDTGVRIGGQVRRTNVDNGVKRTKLCGKHHVIA